jgi:hypothetical protein
VDAKSVERAARAIYLSDGGTLEGWLNYQSNSHKETAFRHATAALTADAQPQQFIVQPAIKFTPEPPQAFEQAIVCTCRTTTSDSLLVNVSENCPVHDSKSAAAPEPLVYKDADAPSCPHEHPLRRTNAGGKIEYSCADCGTLIEFGGVPVPTPLHSWEQIVDRATQAAQKVADALGCGHLHFRSTEWGKRIIAAAVKVAQESRDAEWGAWGIVEVSVRNSSVAEYMKHWEERATKAEAEIARLTARERVTGK